MMINTNSLQIAEYEDYKGKLGVERKVVTKKQSKTHRLVYEKQNHIIVNKINRVYPK